MTMPWTYPNPRFSKNGHIGSFVPATGCGVSPAELFLPRIIDDEEEEDDQKTKEKKAALRDEYKEAQAYLVLEEEEHRRKMRGEFNPEYS